MQSGGLQRQGSRLGNIRVRRGRRRTQTIDVERVPVRRPRRIGVLALIVGFLVLIAAGTALLSLPIASDDQQRAPFMRALFTATSAVCVTGLVVVDTRDHWSGFGEAVILLLIQLGGLGFMTSATLLLMVLRRRISMGAQVTAASTAGQFGSLSARELIRRIALATLAIEAVGVLVMLGAFTLHEGTLTAGHAWRALFTAVSAFNNAGFDIEGGGRSLIGHADTPLVPAVVLVLMVLGGLGYAVWADVWQHRRWRRLQMNTKIVLTTTTALTVLGTALIFVNEALTPGALTGVSVLDAGAISTFESVFARTSGFSVMDLSAANEETLLGIMGLMFVGGASASTAGGIKMNTFTVLLFAIIASVRGDEHAHAFGREIGWRQINRALAVALLAVAAVVGATFLLALTTDAPLVPVMFEVVSAFATCGLSTGLTGALDNASQGIVIVVMFVGRLGPLTFALALAERFERSERVRYPEAEINIG